MSSYTMFAFHQWGFSSGWGDRIPVPELEKDISNIDVIYKTNILIFESKSHSKSKSSSNL